QGGKQVNIAIVGAGAWGTALGLILHRDGHQIALWGHDAKHLEDLRATGRNDRYLPGFDLPPEWLLESDLSRAVKGTDCAIVAVPSKAMRAVAEQMADYRGLLVSVSKGIEFDTGLTMCGVIRASLPVAPIAALSGPSLALEAARGIPTAIVAASEDPAVAQ